MKKDEPMKYYSTRDAEKKCGVTAAEAIVRGIAPDGGLYMPETIPQLSPSDMDALASMNYHERAAFILGKFLDDYTADELAEDCSAAYSETRFSPSPAPLVKVADNLWSLELWHGPTCAFKDMALQLMPRLLVRAIKKTGENRRVLILVATSGDTGKAALEGCRDTDGVGILVFYPEDGVSAMQKLQMTTQEGSGVTVCAIRGNFDDAQTGVKRIFGDAEVRARLDAEGVMLSSANSINFGRLAPQIAYYVSACIDLRARSAIKDADRVNFCVPTGNFGNIFAGYIAKRMGAPIGRLVCASNKNNVLTDFFKTGEYNRNREFFRTISPSMDILVSSNLERLLYLAAGPEKTAEYMRCLDNNGFYKLDGELLSALRRDFDADYTDEDGVIAELRESYAGGYLCDPHTAVAMSVARRMKQPGETVVVSTASPFKFAADVAAALDGKAHDDDLAAPAELSALTGADVPPPLAKTLTLPVRFAESVAADEMKTVVARVAAEI
jgi:threonine synthase